MGPLGGDVVVDGVGGAWPARGATVDARLSGTTARFLLATCGLGEGPYRIDGDAPLRARPMAGGVAALRALGLEVTAARGDALPVEVSGGPAPGGRVVVSGSVSSQFLSGLLLAGPCLDDGLEVVVTDGLVSRSYVDLTLGVMRAFGATASWRAVDRLRVEPGGYRAAELDIEPDASAASYWWAAAAVAGGSVTVPGLGPDSAQGDVAFVDLLERMGCSVDRRPDSITVRRSGPLRGIRADMGDCSDVAQTLAVVAVHAEGPTEVSGIGFIRAKETDRLAAVVSELNRCGVQAEETDDGFVVHPGVPRPTTVHTYDDHRMAMSFALLGLTHPGIRIADPGCVAKTYPGFWDDLESLRTADGAR